MSQKWPNQLKSRFYMNLIFCKGDHCYKNKPKIAQFLNIKLLITLIFNINGGQFYEKILYFGYFKKLKKS